MVLKDIKIISKNLIEIEMGEFETMQISMVKNDFAFKINGIDIELTKEQELEIEKYIKTNIDADELKHVSALEEYDTIFDVLSYEQICRGYHNKKDVIIMKINQLLDVFIKREYYEKCTKLTNLLDRVNKEL